MLGVVCWKARMLNVHPGSHRFLATRLDAIVSWLAGLSFWLAGLGASGPKMVSF